MSLLPDTVERVTVTENWIDAAVNAEDGTVRFTPSVRVVVAGTTITVDPVVARVIDGILYAPDGTSPLRLVANDATGISPTGWTYLVEPSVGHDRTPRSISLPKALGSVVLHTLSPVDPVVPGEVRVRTVEGIGPDPAGNIDLPASTGEVASVNSQTPDGAGNITLTAAHVGALTQAAADSRYVQPAGLDPYATDADLAAGLASKDNAGTAAATVAAHTAAGDPHPQYARRLVVRQAWIHSGDINPLPNTAGLWAPLTGFELDLPAVIGDYVDVDINDLRQANADNAHVDLGVLVGSSIARFMASGSSTPGFEGDPGWYSPSGGLVGRASPRGFTVTSGDLDGANVRFAIVIKSNGTGKLYASDNYPLYWRAMNYGPVG